MDNNTDVINEDQEADSLLLVTPDSAIQSAIFDLCHVRRVWQNQDDPSGVLPWIEERLAGLEQAQRDLAELRKIKAALAVLKELA